MHFCKSHMVNLSSELELAPMDNDYGTKEKETTQTDLNF